MKSRVWIPASREKTFAMSRLCSFAALISGAPNSPWIVLNPKLHPPPQELVRTRRSGTFFLLKVAIDTVIQ